MIASERILTRKGHELFFVGPPLLQGPLPAFFYFSLGGEESLLLDPFNLPAVHLQQLPLRIFSMTLPFHEESEDKHTAIAKWAEEMAQGKTPLQDFLTQAHEALLDLLEEGVITHIATGGLSRGGFIATHLAALEPRIKAVLGLAPMTDLSVLRDFEAINHLESVKALSLSLLAPKLTHTHIRFYIGNRDIAVGTAACFSFIETLANVAFEARVRSPHVELFISPSIGHRGHGTPAHIFAEGAHWIGQQLHLL
ncbi:MAG: alpha/beta hydrolase [Verrucomicrobia bacterium]|nr:alpha/beta hydrolase [Verrucomicrobiota bacterium]